MFPLRSWGQIQTSNRRILPWVHRWHSSSWCWLRSSEKHILTPEERTQSGWRGPWRRRWRSRRRRRAARCWCTCSRGRSPSRFPSRLCHRSRILVPCRNTHKHIPVDIGWSFFLVLKIILKEIPRNNVCNVLECFFRAELRVFYFHYSQSTSESIFE